MSRLAITTSSSPWDLIDARAEQATRLIYRLNNNRAFTLIELMVVIAIIAGTITLALPYITNRNTQIRSALRELTVLSRELHTRAKLNGVTYRLVIDLGTIGRNGEPGPQKYWVERASNQVVLSEREEEAALERSKETDEKKKIDPKGFEVDTTILKQTKELPSGLRFDHIELTRAKKPMTEGKAFIHYLPQGLVDEAAIHIKGEGKQAWTLAIHPLTGRAELISKPVNLDEIKNQ